MNKASPLKLLEITLLFLILLSSPSLEASKNILLASFVMTTFIEQLIAKSYTKIDSHR
ncbi:hypothetical protein [Candidatus Methylopumilus planktonicus]|uniref:hypothetical protein n=1 Tax=Candidatus Methylopumilus planktonicus TaxID=1581557 RepID=UPI003BEF3420